MRNIVKTFCEFIKSNIIFLIIFTAYCLTFYFLGIPGCLVKLTFGIPCPMCGMTRAVIYLVTFHPIKAFIYNPFVYLLPFLAIIFIYSDYKYINKIYRSKVFWITILCLFILSFIIRLILIYPNEPLDIYKKSLILRLIDTIRGFM